MVVVIGVAGAMMGKRATRVAGRDACAPFGIGKGTFVRANQYAGTGGFGSGWPIMVVDLFPCGGEPNERVGALTCAVDPPGAMRAHSFYTGQAARDGWSPDHRIETISGNGSQRDEASGGEGIAARCLVLLYAVAARRRE